MKYLMGLILSFAIGATTFAQDKNADENCDETTSSAKFRNEQNVTTDESGLNSESEVMYGESDQSFTRMERVGDNGSVYYINDPSVNEESEAEITESGSPKSADRSEMEAEPAASEERDLNGEGATEATSADADETTDLELNESTEADATIETETEIESDMEPEVETEIEIEDAEASTSSGGSVFSASSTCNLNKLLDENQGKYKYKQEFNGGELKVEQEKDGDGQVKYESENEYYFYDKNEKGEVEYSHGVAKENEVVELFQNKDGSVDVYYQGHFNNLDEAKALEKGIRFEGVESVCNQ